MTNEVLSTSSAVTEAPSPPKHSTILTIITIALMIVSPMLGLVFMWIFAKWSKRTKMIVTIALFGILVAIAVLAILAMVVLVAINPTAQIRRANYRQARMVTAEMLIEAKKIQLTTGKYPETLDDLLKNNQQLSTEVFQSQSVSYEYTALQNGVDCEITTTIKEESPLNVKCSDQNPDEKFSPPPRQIKPYADTY